MDSPGGYPESLLDQDGDQDDVVYPCKGCGEILEEGKAFELAGNRWHIDCFRCNTCGTLLDSDANLLLLGDGSLICNNCTYSCNHCGNKIEDLAILTGDQAFCANCFRCRNCKRKIENLRYARTSQGIFCMSCHESLMARRRKKSKKPPAPAAPKVDKSLPALPPQFDEQQSQRSAFTPDVETPSEVFSEPTTADASPRPPQPRRGDSSSNFRRDTSPSVGDSARRDNILLPATTYNMEHKHSESDTGDDGILLPFALDPNPAPGPSPLSRASRQFPDRTMGSGSTPSDGKTGRDYFNRPAADPRDKLKENNSRSGSAERPAPASPHIAFQEKGRQPSDHIVNTLRKQWDTSSGESTSLNERSRSQHASPAPASTTDAFKLQEVPKSKKADARRKDSDSSEEPPRASSPGAEMSSRLSRPMIEPTFTSSPPIGNQDSPETASGSSFSSTQRVERPARGDSLRPSGSAQLGDRSGPSPTTPTVEHPKRTSSTHGAPAHLSTGLGISSPLDPSKAFSDVPVPPARSADRRPPPSTDNFTSPRAPPHPPSAHKASESISSLPSENSRDLYATGSGLPRYSAQGDFSMDEDFARLLGNQEKDEKEGGVFRRVSNAVHKHGRSLSERGSVTSRGGHKKWPTNGSIDISSPTIASPDSKEESVNLRNELRRAQQRIAELEAEKNGLQESMHSAADIKQANTVLREKRNTMAVLDTQREMVIRELEIMTEHLKHAKESNGSMDINQLKSDILKDFANSLHKLKDQLGGQIEDLISKRAELTDEISNLIQMKDKGFQEYESLTAQNAKLSAMNRELVENIQKTMNNKKGAPPFDAAANGLGIYSTQHKGGKSELSLDSHSLPHEPSFPHIHDGDSEATLAQPQVVNIRKGKPNKFSKFKKGGQAFTTNVTKGFKGAFGSEQKQEEYKDIKVIGTPYGSVHQQPDIASMSSSLKSKDEQTPKGWFSGSGAKGGASKQANDRFKPMQANNSSTNLAADASTVLFGSDLSARCEFEKNMIPGVVMRCISEVELRGMDVEGVYRKSGGSSQVNQVRSGFEAKADYDISDPDLDIHSITSALKNYFRRLPIPLITFDVYDQFLEAGQLEDKEAQSKALAEAIKEIPKAHRDTLQFLVFHLSRVIEHQGENLMSPLNLAVVFAPTIMRPMDIQRELSDVQQQRVAVQALLENYKTVFGDE
ncbi:RhoGAP domain-containing protein [Stagonosporopsis vannaccii]|nr:RhoGAP domain-containing protein [Stagonosporopsis vannaccii]